MKRFLFLLVIITLSCCLLTAEAAIEIMSDHRQVSFGSMQLGEEKTLAQFGSYQNQITCSSNSNRPWYLKIHVLQPLASGRDTIPLDRFKWRVTSTNGHGTVAHAHEFIPFALPPDVVYISDGSEASGVPVFLQFTYQLELPEAQVSGVYHTTIRFTLTELL